MSLLEREGLGVGSTPVEIVVQTGGRGGCKRAELFVLTRWGGQE